ncbi:EAL domain-containing protein [Erwinia sorbitola]|uniref:EAL domain-containing protein n=1 Tax=Erwinia sorbitola TaxID=2681984 RepID=A0A6I6EH95_9GAMM|nr:EAL domain-containing protein [Erwinia sorbitola]MTD26180.1 EAL domain-containing protein [Erwinia sorbitola]QGU87285.1 EAL domain-containing protein [Erwinia sorbitola]
MKNDFFCTPVHTLTGELIAIDLGYRPQPVAVNGPPGAVLPPLLPQDRLLNQLLIIEEYADYFRQHGLMCSVAIDFQLARAVTESSFIQQILSHLPFVRLKLSEDFPNLHDGMANPLLRTLIEQLNILWLDDLGAGDANLNALQSNMFEAVKLDRQFYLENVNKPFFTVLINHIRQYTNRVIVEGVAGDGHLEALRSSKIWGVQGYFSPMLTLESLEQGNDQRCQNH